MKQFKIISTILLFFISIVAVTAADYQIGQVSVDDVNILQNGNAVFMERGQIAAVEVWLSGVNNSGSSSVDNVRVRAWIGGYEYGDLTATSEIFEVEPGVDYKKVLNLDIPEDIDASKTYTLHVEVFDDVDSVENVYNMRVQEARHSIQIQDVLFTPNDLTVEAGKNLFATIRIKNIGDKKEEDIKVKLSVSQLGLSTRTYVDELIAHEVDNTNEEDSASSNELYLRIPENTKAGNYDVVVQVEFNNGHSVTEQSFVLNVLGAVPKIEPTAMVTIDTSTRQIAQGSSSIYKLSFANLEDKQKSYTLEVSGAESWATVSSDPAVINVNPDSTSDAYVYLAVNKDAAPGLHMLTIKIKSGDEVVKEVNLGADVALEKKTSAWDVIKKAILVIFIILLVILIIIGMIMGIRKFRKDEVEEPGITEAESYYFYPNQ